VDQLWLTVFGEEVMFLWVRFGTINLIGTIGDF